MQEPRAPVHQVDTNPEKLTAPGRVVDWRGAEATLPRVWSRTKGLKLAWTEWRTWRRAVSGVQPPPPPGREGSGRGGRAQFQMPDLNTCVGDSIIYSNEEGKGTGEFSLKYL